MTPLPRSFSTLNNFDTCPRQYAEVKVYKRVADAVNDAGLAGGWTHEQFEDYLKAAGGTVLPDTYPTHVRDWPPGLKPPAAYKDYLDAILAAPGDIYIEHEIGITKRGIPCAFDAADVWMRAIIDVLNVNGTRARIIDHKTGKRKKSNQLKLAALLVFYHFPEVEEITTAFTWLVASDVDPDVYRRDQITELWGDFASVLARYAEAFRAEVFVPKPSGLCNGWCPVRSCEFWKPKRSR